jgi:hypothetical protein
MPTKAFSFSLLNSARLSKEITIVLICLSVAWLLHMNICYASPRPGLLEGLLSCFLPLYFLVCVLRIIWTGLRLKSIQNPNMSGG